MQSKSSSDVDWRIKVRALKWFQMDKKWDVLQELIKRDEDGFEVNITHLTVSAIVYQRWNGLNEGKFWSTF